MASPIHGHEFEQTPGDGEGQGSLECCSPWERKELDMIELLNKKTKTKIQKEGHVGTQEEDSHLQAKKRSPRGNQPFSHLDLRLLASQTVRKWKKIIIIKVKPCSL